MLASASTVRRMRSAGALRYGVAVMSVAAEDAIPMPDEARRLKQKEATAGTDTAYQLAKK